MIKNDRQLALTKEQAEKFEKSIFELEKKKGDSTSIMFELQLKGLKGQYQSLIDEIEEYKALKDGKLFISQSLKVSEVYQLLIKARISMNISQLELADRLGTTQQQIQRYESSNYETASLARIAEIIDALALPIRIEKFCCFRQTFHLPNELSQDTLSVHQKKLQEKGNIFFA